MQDFVHNCDDKTLSPPAALMGMVAMGPSLLLSTGQLALGLEHPMLGADRVW